MISSKKLSLFFLATFLLSSSVCMASVASINMHHNGSHGTHSEHYLPADAPEVYFDSEAMEIIIEAEGYADYYVVEAISMVSGQTLIYTQIDGYGDTIDVSSLPDAYYQIIITSSNNNVFEGTFLIE